MAERDYIVNIDTLWDTVPDGKKLAHRVSVRLPQDLYNVITSGLIHENSLPFQGNLEHFLVYAAAEATDSLKNFVAGGHKTMIHGIRRMQEHLSTERYVITIEESIGQQVENLKIWTGVQEWQSVIDDLVVWAGIVDELPQRVWKARAAKSWLTNREVKKLRNIWLQEMEPEEARKVNEVFEHWEQLGRV